MCDVNRQRMYINIEAQKFFYPGYDLVTRGIIYPARLLSADIKPDEKKQVLESEYGIPMSIELEEEVNSMCNLSEAIEERGIEKGIEQGIERGVEQGKIIATYDFIQSGMITPEAGTEKLGVSIEQLKCDMEKTGFSFPH